MSREMKHSGIEWIGEIPKEWRTCRLKGIAHSLTKGNGITKEEVFPDGDTPCVRYGEIYSKYNGAFIECKSKTRKDILASTRYFNFGDILFAGTGELVEEIGKNIVYVGVTSCLAGGDIIILKHSQNPVFLNYALNSQYAQSQKSCGKAKLKVVHISSSEIGDLQVILPPLSEQQKIANYLDKVCGEVDEMIALQEQMIEELKAYKQSVITEAVTKGLNPNAPMRDSGIDWIGEVPKHWGTPAISYVAAISSGSTPDRNNPFFWKNGDINWIKTGELQNNRISESEEKVTEHALNNTSLKLYPKNTILIAMYGQGKTRGMTALLDVPCTTNQACAALSVRNNNLCCEYLWKCLMGAYDAIREKAVGTGQPNLNSELISKFVITLPPINEQKEIVNYIDEIIPQIDALIAIKQAKIEELKEYKKSVIYEYVTGKKEVV